MIPNNSALASLPLPIQVLIVLVLLAILLFEIFMFVHVIKNKSLSMNKKLLWAIGMLLLHPFVAIVYFFTDYKNK